MSMRMVVAAAIGIPLVVIGLLWIRNYLRRGSAPTATSDTSETVSGVLSAVVMSFVIALSGVAMFFGTIGDILATWPAASAQTALAVLAIAGFSSMVEVGVVTGTILVIVILLVYAAVTN